MVQEIKRYAARSGIFLQTFP